MTMPSFETMQTEDLAAARADAMDRIRQQHSLSEKGLGSLMIANGGALIGLFTFVGNAVGKDASLRFDLPYIWAAFVIFCVGVVFALGAYLLAFLSQDRFYHQAMHEVERIRRGIVAGEADVDKAGEVRANRQGFRFYNGAIVCAGLGIFAFMIGSGLALWGVLPA